MIFNRAEGRTLQSHPGRASLAPVLPGCLQVVLGGFVAQIAGCLCEVAKSQGCGFLLRDQHVFNQCLKHLLLGGRGRSRAGERGALGGGVGLVDGRFGLFDGRVGWLDGSVGLCGGRDMHDATEDDQDCGSGDKPSPYVKVHGG